MLEGPVGVILPYRPFAIGVLLVVVVGLGLLACSAVVRPGGRVRAAGLLACSAGVATLAFAIGWGRAGFVESNPSAITQASRYVTLVAPLACCGYFAWELRRNRVVQYLLFISALLMFPVNKLAGIGEGANHAELLDHVAADAKSGMAAEKLAEKYWRKIYPVDPSVLSARFEMLRDARELALTVHYHAPHRAVPTKPPLRATPPLRLGNDVKRFYRHRRFAFAAHRQQPPGRDSNRQPQPLGPRRILP